MHALTAAPFSVWTLIALKVGPVALKAQVLINSRASDAPTARRAVPLFEAALPLVEPPEGPLGELIRDSGAELRGADGEWALIKGNRAWVGDAGEVLAAVRNTAIRTCEKLAGEHGYAAGCELAKLSAKPKLRVVA